MTKPLSPDPRTSAEKRFERARLTDETAIRIIEAERLARDKKTAQLRELRLARKATAGLPIVDERLSKKKPRKIKT